MSFYVIILQETADLVYKTHFILKVFGQGAFNLLNTEHSVDHSVYWPNEDSSVCICHLANLLHR